MSRDCGCDCRAVVLDEGRCDGCGASVTPPPATRDLADPTVVVVTDGSREAEADLMLSRIRRVAEIGREEPTS